MGFEENPKAKSIIRSVINIAKEMNMRTLCEGVETEEQAKFLKDIGCERLQGYLFGKALSYDDLHALINEGKLKLSKECK